ncbi:MAG: iron ABC transporter permease [Saccharospirillum sp.]|nr:iron ABC transporter permease [Saccharospirillum sp.]
MTLAMAPPLPVKSRRIPWLLLIPAVLVALSMLIPVVYLFLRAFQADVDQALALVFRSRNLDLLFNTLKLAAGVLAVATFLALPLAWIVTRVRLVGQGFWTTLAIVPLAIPGYVMAYSLLSIGGHYGFMSRVFGISMSNIQGYWGAVWALALYTFPYLFLNIRSALQGLDASLEESAQSLGYGRFDIATKIVIPQILPALMAGFLVIGLYVLGDFGAVALMRYDAFSYAIYNQYAGAYDRIYAAWLSLMLLALALAFVLIDVLLVRRRLSSVGSSSGRQVSKVSLGRYWLIAGPYMAFVYLASIALPAAMLLYWMLQVPVEAGLLTRVSMTFLNSAGAALPAALLAATLAIPICYLSVRYPSRLTALIERSTYIGYSLPPLTLALAMVFFALQTAFFFYQTLGLLIVAWTMATLVLAMGPIRSAIMQARPNIEEASYSLGYSGLQTFRFVLFPRLRRGTVAGIVLVFLFCMKELPITFLLSPTGFSTLAVSVFSRTAEGQMAEAAPFAVAILLFSSLSVGMMLRQEKSQ